MISPSAQNAEICVPARAYSKTELLYRVVSDKVVNHGGQDDRRNGQIDKDEGVCVGKDRWVTVGYILFVAWLATGSNSFVLVKANLSLNEFADAAAGLFAPLAFLWLFVATMVQSGELALQREELQLTRQEFVQNRAVAKEQAEEARNQARFIGTQTEITIRAEADRHLVAVLDSLKELLMQSFQTQITAKSSANNNADGAGEEI